MSGGHPAARQSRRAILKKLGLIGTAGTTAGAGVVLMSKPALAAQMSASNITLTGNAGKVQDVFVQPDVTYDWDGFNNPPDTADITVDARLPSTSNNETSTSYEEVGAKTDLPVDSTALDGSGSYSFENAGTDLSLIDGTSISAGTFEPSQGGGRTEEKTDVQLQVNVTLTTSSNTYSTTFESQQFTVTVVNEEGTVTGGGNANPGGNVN